MTTDNWVRKLKKHSRNTFQEEWETVQPLFAINEGVEDKALNDAVEEMRKKQCLYRLGYSLELWCE